MAEYLRARPEGWKRRYASPPDNLVRDFYLPALGRSTSYDRAVGFFSSTSLALISPVMDDFVRNGGRMRVLCSPANLSESDLNAAHNGENLRSLLRESLSGSLSVNVPQEVLQDRLKLLTWMIARGVLEFKVALRQRGNRYHIVHEKIGVFSDPSGDFISFSGSPNESVTAAFNNAESFPVFCSWLDESQRAYAEQEKERFELLWNPEGRLEVVTWDVSQWVHEPLRKYFGEREPYTEGVRIDGVGDDDDREESGEQFGCARPEIPHYIQLRDYQKQAINGWMQQRARGVFAMATGTGKTVTALAGLTRLAQFAETQGRSLLILVVVPSIDLVQQWQKEARSFSFRTACFHGDLTNNQRQEVLSLLALLRPGIGGKTGMVVTTADSLAAGSEDIPGSLRRLVQRHKGLLCLVGDEMHSLGTARRLGALPKGPAFTLGLSATPKRHGDEEGTEALIRYFGKPIISISIKEAIEELKVLVPYDYIPRIVNLTDEEELEYRKLSAKIAAAFGSGNETSAEVYIRKRVRLVQHAENKLQELRQLYAEGLKDESQQLIYLAEGSEPGTENRLMDVVENLLTEEFGMKVAKYVGETSAELRAQLQLDLTAGRLQALLAMKCLDEGVDIPSARIGVIASSTQNPRQFVQRRGRLLRRDRNNAKASARIYDLLVLPQNAGNSDSERRLIGMELSRAYELADAARNRESRISLIELALKYGLDANQYEWMGLSGADEMQEWVQ